MTNPQLLARQHDDAIENNDIADKRAMQPRAKTDGGTSVSEVFNDGTVHAARFDSTDGGDRGGVVLRLTLDSLGQAFVPYAVNVDGGVEIHLAGEAEAKLLIAALRSVIG